MTCKDCINDYVENAYNQSNEKDYLKYAEVDEQLKSDVSNEIDLEGYTHALRDNDIRHIRNSHGEKTNEKYPVTKDDLKLIPYIVQNYDKVFVAKHNGNYDSVYYVKVGPDGTTYYLEQATQKYHNEKLLVNKQMIKTGIDDIPNIKGLKDAINKKESISQYLADLNEVHEEYARSVKEKYSTYSISQEDAYVNKSKPYILTADEKKVIQKELDNRIAEAEKDGSRLSDEEKKEIRKKVKSDLEKGYISIDTIEEALGGDDYRNYKTAVDEREDLKKELDELRRMKKGDMNDIQQDRLAELKAMDLDDTSKSDELKTKLNDNVFGLARGTRLEESYREKSRRGEAFKADTKRYSKDERATVQAAIDSGVLNNTNRSHELVDFVAKLSKDKGIEFDFTNNEKLRESGFAIKGKTINGYVKGSKVTLNVNSDMLQATVGHEVAHILEGTEHYSALQECFKEYLGESEYKNRLNGIKKTYKNIKGADFEKELLADLVGEHLFSDEKFLKSLSGNTNLFKRVWNEIKYLCKSATAGTKEQKQLLEVQKTFQKVWQEAASTQKNNLSDNTRYSVSIDRYTEKQYNNYGWVSVNDVLTGKELKKLYSQFADIKNNKNYNYKNRNGEYLIPVGDKYNSYDKIVYIKGTNQHPVIRQVISVIDDVTIEEKSDCIKEVLEYETRYHIDDAFETYEAYAGKQLFSRNSIQDYDSYNEIKRGKRNGRGKQVSLEADGSDRTGNNGKGVQKAGSDIEQNNSTQKADSNEPAFSNGENDVKYSLSEADEQAHKEKQLEIINETNPAPNEYNTWIRNKSDIKTFKEALLDAEYADYNEFNPDYTRKTAEKALESGEITVYSSYPIENGVFVSPSRMEAESYSGNGKVYEKTVPINDVAWIDITQGQYAKVENGVNYSLSDNDKPIAPVKNTRNYFGISGKDVALEKPAQSREIAPKPKQISPVKKTANMGQISKNIGPIKTNNKKITIGMTDSERAEVLKDKVIKNVPVVSDSADNISSLRSWGDVNRLLGKEKRNLIKKIADEFGAFKAYSNEDVELEFEFSRNNFEESYSKQNKNFESFSKMFSVFDSVIKNAVGIEVHNKNDEGYKSDKTLKGVYVLMSAFEDGEDIVPVKLEIKEFNDKNNKLYVAVALEKIKKAEVSGQGLSTNEITQNSRSASAEVSKQGNTQEGVTQNSRSANISIPDIFKKINASDKDFLKYIPEGMRENADGEQPLGNYKVNSEHSEPPSADVSVPQADTESQAKPLGPETRGTENTLKPYSQHEKENWSNSKRIVLYEDENQFREFIKSSLTDKSTNKKLYFGKIPNNLANLIESKTGINVNGYNCSLSANEIRKIFKDHGNDLIENPRGQRAITESDIINIPNVIQSPTDIKLSNTTYNGKPLINFTQNSDSKMTVAAVVSDKHLDLFVQTAYVGIKKGNLAAPIAEQAAINTPEASSGTVSNNIISKTDTKSQAKPLGPVRKDIVKSERPLGPVREDVARNKKQLKWVETSTESESVKGKIFPEDLNQELINYAPISNKETLEKANRVLNSEGYLKSIIYFKGAVKNDNVSLTDMALGQRLIQEAIKNGDYEVAGDLIQDISLITNDYGQKIQIVSLIQKMTPEGQLKMLNKIVEHGKAKGDKAFEGVEITDDMKKKILSVYDENGAYDQAELNAVMEKVKKQIADQMKVSAMEKVNAWRYLSMLGNPKTHIRNIISNVAMYGTRAAKNVFARTIETIAPVKNRTKTFRIASQDVKNFSNQTAIEMKEIISGDNKFSDESSIKAKREMFKSKIMNGVYDFNSDMLEKEDWWFSKAAFKQALSEFLTANGIRTEADIKNNPKLVEKAKLYAVEEAQVATFRQFSFLAQKIGELERKNKATQLFVGAVIPFKKTPINIAKAGINYSPLGFAKTLGYDIAQVKKGNMEASTLVDDLSQNLTGTALALAGYMLAKIGFINGSGDDDKEDKYDSQLGKQSYSINIEGKTYSLSWLAPAAMPLFVGANAYERLEETEEWNPDVLVESLAQTLDPMNEMSVLSGVTNILSSYEGGTGKYADMLETMVQNYASQFIPTSISQLASATDEYKRSTKVAGDSDSKFVDETVNKLKYKIPVLRQTLEPSTDIWGNKVKQSDTFDERAFESFLAPYAKRANTASSVDKELKEVYHATGDNGVIPNIPSNYFNYSDEKYSMSSAEYTEFKKIYGQTAYNTIEDLFDTSTYKRADDSDKAKMINDVYDYARDVARKNYLSNKGIEYTNATKDGVKYYKENNIAGAIKNDMTTDEYALFNENESKYYVAKAMGGYEKYNEYKSALYNIKADKNKYGKSISGSRKTKVINYINGLNADYGEKLIIYKNEYKSDNTYNYEIVEYLNGRDDISYSEMIDILTELGFKVDSSGYARW